MGMEYVASYVDSRQISPDDFEVFQPALKVTDETTIGEIRAWRETGMSQLQKNGLVMDNIRITELLSVKKEEEVCPKEQNI